MPRRARGEGHVRKRPDGRWEARLSYGPRGQTVILSGYGSTRDEAWAKLDARVQEEKRRRRLGDAAAHTVASFMQWWIDVVLPEKIADGHMTATTLAGYERHVRLRIIPALGRLELQHLAPADVMQWLADMRRAGVHDRQRQYARAVLSTALNTAMKLGYVTRNACAAVDPPRVRYERRDEVPVADARRLLHAASTARLSALWTLMLHVPLRPGEPLGSEWSAFDLDRGLYRISRNLVRVGGEWRLHNLKGHRERTVPIPPPVVEALAAHRERQQLEASYDPGWHDPVIRDVDGKARPMNLAFRSPDGSPLWWSRLGEELQDICEAAKVPRMTPHGLRHAATTLLQSRGTHPAIVQQLGGWATGSMVDHYTAGMDAAMREAVDGLADWLGE